MSTEARNPCVKSGPRNGGRALCSGPLPALRGGAQQGRRGEESKRQALQK